MVMKVGRFGENDSNQQQIVKIGGSGEKWVLVKKVPKSDNI